MIRIPVFLAALLLSTIAWAAAAPADGVNAFHGALLDNMKHGGTCAARAQRLQPVIGRNFDVPFIAQRILRKHWAELAPDQQAQFSAALEDMVVTTYAGQFTRFGGETFTVDKTEDISAGNKVVHAVFKHGDSTRFDYVMRADAGGAWRIVNIIADGVSDLAIRTAQYDKLYKDKGYAGLLAYIKDQTAKTRASC